MKRYRLIREYPGSPEIGKIISVNDTNINSYNPYPEFWKEIKEKFDTPRKYSTKESQDLHLYLDSMGVPTDNKFIWFDVLHRLRLYEKMLTDKNEELRQHPLAPEESFPKEDSRPVLFQLPDENGAMVDVRAGDRVYMVYKPSLIVDSCIATPICSIEERDLWSPLFATVAAAEKWLLEWQEKKKLLSKPENASMVYLFIHDTGEIKEDYSICNGRDVKRNLIGNFFHTKEQAEYARDNYPITKYNQFWEDLQSGKITI